MSGDKEIIENETPSVTGIRNGVFIQVQVAY